MTKQEMAFHLFLKRMPNEPLTDSNRKWVLSKAEEAFELAEMFLLAEEENYKKYRVVHGLPEPEL